MLRSKPASIVSKSVNVIQTSGKDKSAKPPRRLSVPAKSSISPLPKSLPKSLPKTTSTISPICRTSTKRFDKGQGNNEKQVSDAPKSINRKKFSVLSSVSYWSSQIKLSESALKHSISLGFFKLALESGCVPLPRMRDELKSYIRRHNLVGLEEPLKELLICYNISEDMNELQVSETCSHVVPGETSWSSTSIGVGKKLKPKSPGSDKAQNSSSVTKPATKKLIPKKILGSNDKGPVKRNSTKPNSANSGNILPQKKGIQISKKQVATTEKASTENQGEILVYMEKPKTENPEENLVEEKGMIEPLHSGEMELHNKENTDDQQIEEISLIEEVI
ncbi:hypothetical protein ACHQM5_006152 [Ranunculus cassubicifolius]